MLAAGELQGSLTLIRPPDQQKYSLKSSLLLLLLPLFVDKWWTAACGSDKQGGGEGGGGGGVGGALWQRCTCCDWTDTGRFLVSRPTIGPIVAAAVLPA